MLHRLAELGAQRSWSSQGLTAAWGALDLLYPHLHLIHPLRPTLPSPLATTEMEQGRLCIPKEQLGQLSQLGSSEDCGMLGRCCPLVEKSGRAWALGNGQKPATRQLWASAKKPGPQKPFWAPQVAKPGPEGFPKPRARREGWTKEPTFPIPPPSFFLVFSPMCPSTPHPPSLLPS